MGRQYPALLRPDGCQKRGDRNQRRFGIAGGQCDADATTFTVKATLGALDYGISSNPFLTAHFKTTAFSMTVTANPDGTWTYSEDTTMTISDRPEPFHHTDGNTLHLVTPPTPNPLAQAAQAAPAKPTPAS